MNISMTKRRWKHLFRLIDKNSDMQLTYDEFAYFLFPDSDKVLTRENERVAKIRLSLIEKEKLLVEPEKINSRQESILRMAQSLKKEASDLRVVAMTRSTQERKSINVAQTTMKSASVGGVSLTGTLTRRASVSSLPLFILASDDIVREDTPAPGKPLQSTVRGYFI